MMRHAHHAYAAQVTRFHRQRGMAQLQRTRLLRNGCVYGARGEKYFGAFRHRALENAARPEPTQATPAAWVERWRQRVDYFPSCFATLLKIGNAATINYIEGAIKHLADVNNDRHLTTRRHAMRNEIPTAYRYVDRHSTDFAAVK